MTSHRLKWWRQIVGKTVTTDHRKVHELHCYLTFLSKVQWKMRNLEKQDAERRKQDTFMGKILRFYRGGSPYLHIVAE